MEVDRTDRRSVRASARSDRWLPVITENGRRVWLRSQLFGSSRETLNFRQRLSLLTGCRGRPNDEYDERALSDERTKMYDPKNDDAWIISDTAVPLKDGTDERNRSGDSR